MARKFFYVCAGLFLLTLAYQLGTTSAQAQFVVDGASVADGTPSAAVGRTLYVGVSGTPVPVPIPGTSRVIATSDANQGFVLLENGDVFNWQGESNGWVPFGNLFGGATPAMRESWGQLKSRYRATPSVTPGTTVTPGAEKK